MTRIKISVTVYNIQKQPDSYFANSYKMNNYYNIYSFLETAQKTCQQFSIRVIRVLLLNNNNNNNNNNHYTIHSFGNCPKDMSTISNQSYSSAAAQKQTTRILTHAQKQNAGGDVHPAKMRATFARPSRSKTMVCLG